MHESIERLSCMNAPCYVIHWDCAFQQGRSELSLDQLDTMADIDTCAKAHTLVLNPLKLDHNWLTNLFSYWNGKTSSQRKRQVLICYGRVWSVLPSG